MLFGTLSFAETDISLGLAGAIISFVVSILAILRVTTSVSAKIAKIELKVDTIWEFLIRRGLGSAVARGFGEVKSPFRPSLEGRKLMNGLSEELKIFYRSFKTEPSRAELTMAIEQRFGDRILRELCIPHKLSMGECLILADAIAREPDIEHTVN